MSEDSGARMQDWGTIVIGDILELQKRVWQVIDRHGDVVTVEREDGHTHTGTPTGQVKVISSAQSEMERVTALVQVRLGGETVALKDVEGRWLVPASYPDVGSLITHMWLLHGTVVKADSIREGLRKHEWLHRPENKGKEYEHHYHDPDFHRERDWEPPPAMGAPR